MQRTDITTQRLRSATNLSSRRFRISHRLCACVRLVLSANKKWHGIFIIIATSCTKIATPLTKKKKTQKKHTKKQSFSLICICLQTEKLFGIPIGQRACSLTWSGSCCTQTKLAIKISVSLCMFVVFWIIIRRLLVG